MLSDDSQVSSLYVIRDGSVKMTRYDDGAGEASTELHAGDYFGEECVVNGVTCPCDAITIEKTVLITLTRDNLLAVIDAEVR